MITLKSIPLAQKYKLRTLFFLPFSRVDGYFYVVSPSRATDKPFYRAKAAVPLFLSYFKTLSINPFPGTEHATSRYAVQSSND